MANNQWLYEKYDGFEDITGSPAEIPPDITGALKYPLREYQEIAFKRFIHYFEKDQKSSNHIMFEMATGAGKTLLMAALMLYLYKKGYRHFIFFVNSTTILEKTKANFATIANAKYLFADSITLDSKRITINQIENLDEAASDDLNIIFTTIQGLHTTLGSPRENAVTFDDLAQYKLVLLGDEAHHLQTQSKQQELELAASWEQTVERVFKGNSDNVLLELTATAELNKDSIAAKYRDKLLYRYPLANFCSDGYSKSIGLIINKSDNRYRMLLALLVNQFRREVGAAEGISLKPVLLFKSTTIKESKDNQQEFLKILEELKDTDIEEALQQTKMNSEQSPLIDAMLAHWQQKQVVQIIHTLIAEFTIGTIINVNDDKEKGQQQLQLNSLEDRNNPVRVIFAVNKLNEGWDVLNLFDIVKLFETKNPKQTTQEAQLIGRGARYYPFSKDKHDDNYFTRKYDAETSHPLRFLETLHYHTKDNSAFITNLNKQLEEQGLLQEKNFKEVSLKLKKNFEKSAIYREGVIFVNRKLHRKDTLKEYLDKRATTIPELLEPMRVVFSNPEKLNVKVNIYTKVEEKDIAETAHGEFIHTRTKKMEDMPYAIFYKALSKNKFYCLDELGILLNIQSMRDIYTRYLNVIITFAYDDEKLAKQEPTADDKLQGVIAFLDKLQKSLLITEYIGSEFGPKQLREVFKNKKLTISKNKEVMEHTFEYFAQDKIIGTDEEKSLIQYIDGYLSQIDNIKTAWLIRNEHHFTLYKFDDGRGFQPDFVLLIQKKDNTFLTYQLFIEPKGKHLQDFDRWKEKFMRQINEKYPEPIQIKTKKQRIIGLPFYNAEMPNNFIEQLENQLK